MDKAKRLTALADRLTRLECHMLPDRVALLEDGLQAVLDDAEFEEDGALSPDLANTPLNRRADAMQRRALEMGLPLTLDACRELAAVVVPPPPANTAANFDTPDGVTASRQSSDNIWRNFETGDAPPSVPRPPTVGDDYHFFLRMSGYNDHPCLWRAFLAGRMTA